MCRPYAIGFTILEMAKYSMFDTYYHKLLPNFDDLEMILTDVSHF